MENSVGAGVESACVCSICNEKKTSFIQKEVAWNAYTSTHFGDQVHEYIFCEDCIHDMVEGKPLKKPLTQYIVADPALSWTGLNVDTLSEVDKNRYSKKFLTQLEEINAE